MARLRAAARRVRALPGRARAALALAVLLILAGAVWIAVAAADAGDDDEPAAGGGSGRLPTTTLATGDLDVEAPDGWQVVPLPSLGVGLAVPPGWEAVVLSPEGLATLADSSPAIPGFVESATAAAGADGVFYAAGQDAEGRVSDVVLRAAPEAEVTDAAGLEDYARSLASASGRAGARVEVVDGAERPTVQLSFRVGAGDEVAEATETLVLGPRGTVWSVTLTSDDPAVHDDLADAVTGTLTLSG
jgi:hypothetical protein